ncbi:MAG: hypothetical protein VW665_02355 [Candidatus Puniceispirillum sp.]|jgi:hypothetical protein
MKRFAIVGVILVGLCGAGMVILSSWQIPAPSIMVDKVIPNDSLPK